MHTFKLLFITIALISVINSHKFFAENNFICTLCKESMKLIKIGELEKLENVLNKFPKAMHLFEHKDNHLAAMTL